MNDQLEGSIYNVTRATEHWVQFQSACQDCIQTQHARYKGHACIVHCMPTSIERMSERPSSPLLIMLHEFQIFERVKINYTIQRTTGVLNKSFINLEGIFGLGANTGSLRR